MASAVVTAGDFVFEHVDEGGVASGLEVAVMAGADGGSVQLEVALSRLMPGGTVAGHLHFYEESFYILSGEAYTTSVDIAITCGRTTSGSCR